MSEREFPNSFLSVRGTSGILVKQVKPGPLQELHVLLKINPSIYNRMANHCIEH